MVESTTIGRVNNHLIKGVTIPLGRELIAGQNIASISGCDLPLRLLMEDVGPTQASAPVLHEGVLFNTYGNGEPIEHEPISPAFGEFIGKPWRHIPNESLFGEQSFIHGSNDPAILYDSYQHRSDENRELRWFVVPVRETTNISLLDILRHAVVAGSDVWTSLLRDLAEWEEMSGAQKERERLISKLRVSFELDPVEDGLRHPAEKIIADALSHSNKQRVLKWLRDFCLEASHPSFAASVLRCLGRLTTVGTASWRADLVRGSLATSNIEIRDAAVHAVESWGDSDLLEVLEKHSETEPWLQQYILDVIDDLAN